MPIAARPPAPLPGVISPDYLRCGGDDRVLLGCEPLAGPVPLPPDSPPMLWTLRLAVSLLTRRDLAAGTSLAPLSRTCCAGLLLPGRRWIRCVLGPTFPLLDRLGLKVGTQLWVSGAELSACSREPWRTALSQELGAGQRMTRQSLADVRVTSRLAAFPSETTSPRGHIQSLPGQERVGGQVRLSVQR